MDKLTQNQIQISSLIDENKLADVFRFISFAPLEVFHKHEHARIEINYVKKGNCIINTGTESVSFNENEMMIICPDVTHSFEAGKYGCTLMQLEFLPEVFTSLIIKETLIDAEQIKTNIFSKNNNIIKIINNLRIMRTVERIVAEMGGTEEGYEHLVNLYYTELLILIQRYMNKVYSLESSNITLQTAIKHIWQNYSTDISVESVARYVGVSDRYLRKLFTQHLNISPLEYINQLRINKSIELLRISDMSIKEICFVCGFKSPQYFSRIFKKQAGLSPSEINKH